MFWGDWLEKEYDGRDVKRRKLSREISHGFSRFNGKPVDLNKQVRVCVCLKVGSGWGKCVWGEREKDAQQVFP